MHVYVRMHMICMINRLSIIARGPGQGKPRPPRAPHKHAGNSNIPVILYAVEWLVNAFLNVLLNHSINIHSKKQSHQ